jgi:malate dehydrogenase (oxaloacetate-decarboxylating)(NADP+)
VLKAIAFEEGICHPILLGVKEIIQLKENWFYADLEIIDPKIKEEDVRRNNFAHSYWESRKRKGFPYDAQKLRERNYFAAMMVNEGDADGLVTGHSRSYSSVVKPMLQLVDKAAGASITIRQT